MSDIKVLKIKGHDVLIDIEDYIMVSRFKWHIRKSGMTFYAVTNIRVHKKQTSIGMHKLITGIKYIMVDHINRNGLDNRKENLRPCTYQQNAMNRLRRYKNPFGYVGVFKRNNEYGYQIQLNGKKYRGFGFSTPEDAAKAYDEKNKELYGNYGIRNFTS